MTDEWVGLAEEVDGWWHPRWPMLRDEEREQWEFRPLVGVGPLLFGMTRRQVTSALGQRHWSGGDTETHYALPDRSGLGHSFTVYYRLAIEHDGSIDAPNCPESTSALHRKMTAGYVLAAVAVDARIGPQVTWDGLQLVGRTPSTTSEAFFARLKALGLTDNVYYAQCTDYSSEDVGLVLRAQRVGDILLTRPVFVSAPWTEGMCDETEGPIPNHEWYIR